MLSKAIPDAIANINPEDVDEEGDTGVAGVTLVDSSPRKIQEFVRLAEAKINGVYEHQEPAQWTRVHRASEA